MQAIEDIYTAAPSVEMAANAAKGVPEVSGTHAEQETCPPLLVKVSGNEVTGSLATSVLAMIIRKSLSPL